MQITWLSYFGSENQGLPLRSWFVTCWLWRHIPIVTSLAVPSSCVVTQTPMGTNSGTRRRKRTFPLLFVNCDRGRIEIDHLYGLCCRGWYCNPEQHSLCRPARPQAAARRPAQLVLFRIAVPTTPAHTVSWSIPITNEGSFSNTNHRLGSSFSPNPLASANFRLPLEISQRKPAAYHPNIFPSLFFRTVIGTRLKTGMLQNVYLDTI